MTVMTQMMMPAVNADHQSRGSTVGGGAAVYTGPLNCDATPVENHMYTLRTSLESLGYYLTPTEYAQIQQMIEESIIEIEQWTLVSQGITLETSDLLKNLFLNLKALRTTELFKRLRRVPASASIANQVLISEKCLREKLNYFN